MFEYGQGANNIQGRFFLIQLTTRCHGNRLDIFKYWIYKVQEIEIEIDENDRISDLIWHKLYTINVDSFITNVLPIQSQLNIYTDGSKTKAHVGAGFSIMRGNQVILEGKRRLPDEATAFQAELMAIKMAMFDLAGSWK